MLTSIQEDVLKEYMNISVGDAANLLSEMLNKKINLKIPEVELLPLNQGKENLHKSLPDFLQGHLVSSSIKFGTKFNGIAHLIFPATKTKLLVNLCMGETAKDNDETNLTDADFDAIREIGNIILNAIVGGLGNLLETRIDYELPKVELISLKEVKSDIESKEQNYLLIVHNNFLVENTKIKGSILVVLSMDSINYLVDKIDDIVVDIYGE